MPKHGIRPGRRLQSSWWRFLKVFNKTTFKDELFWRFFSDDNLQERTFLKVFFIVTFKDEFFWRFFRSQPSGTNFFRRFAKPSTWRFFEGFWRFLNLYNQIKLTVGYELVSSPCIGELSNTFFKLLSFPPEEELNRTLKYCSVLRMLLRGGGSS